MLAQSRYSTVQFITRWGAITSKIEYKGLGQDRIGYLSEAHLKPKSLEISFVHNTRFSCQIVLQFCIEHDTITVVFCAKCRNDWVTELWLNEISRDLGSRWLLNRYPIFHSPSDFELTAHIPYLTLSGELWGADNGYFFKKIDFAVTRNSIISIL